MVSPIFYKKTSAVSSFFGGKTPHYKRKPKVNFIGSYPYVLEYGEDMYTLAEKFFGLSGAHLWTVIAEANPLKYPDDWEAGETIQIPLLVINEDASIVAKITEPTSIPVLPANII